MLTMPYWLTFQNRFSILTNFFKIIVYSKNCITITLFLVSSMQILKKKIDFSWHEWNIKCDAAVEDDVDYNQQITPQCDGCLHILYVVTVMF